MNSFSRNWRRREMQNDGGDRREFPPEQRGIKNGVDSRMMDQRKRKIGIGITGEENGRKIRHQQKNPRNPPDGSPTVGQQRPHQSRRSDREHADNQAPEQSHWRYSDLSHARHSPLAPPRSPSGTPSAAQRCSCFTSSGNRVFSTGPSGIWRDLAEANASSHFSERRKSASFCASAKCRVPRIIATVFRMQMVFPFSNRTGSIATGLPSSCASKKSSVSVQPRSQTPADTRSFTIELPSTSRR